MKKHIWYFVLMIIIIFGLCSCRSEKIDSNTISGNKINSEFKANMEVKQGDNYYSCDIVKSCPKMLYIKFINPEEIRDLTYQIEDKKSEISYNNLKYQKNSNILPDDSFVSILTEILDYISLNSHELDYIKNKEYVSEYSGHVNNRDFKVYANRSTGFLNEIIVESENLYISFCNVSNVD